jgi:hypothetical protein
LKTALRYNDAVDCKHTKERKLEIRAEFCDMKRGNNSILPRTIRRPECFLKHTAVVTDVTGKAK